MHSETYYKNLRKKYTPKEIKLIIVVESPPSSGKYFYDDKGSVKETFFNLIAKCFLPFNPSTKSEGLRELCNAGILIVDSVYTPLDKISSHVLRGEIMEKHSKKLEEDLKKLVRKNKTKIILVGTVVRNVLEKKLREKFYVINDGVVVPYNSSGQNSMFRYQIHFLFEVRNVNLVIYC